MFFPDIEQVKKGFSAPLKNETYYIKTVRYPKKGGYISYIKKITEGVNVRLNSEVIRIDLKEKRVKLTNGEFVFYDKLVNTLPLPTFISLCNVPNNLDRAVRQLNCSSVLILNIMANHPTKRKENWMYVYDEDKYSTRINCTELLSSNNAPQDKTGVQVEVYFSDKYPLKESIPVIVEKVCDELIGMGIVESKSHIENVFTKQIRWANVIFDKNRKIAQEEIFFWLEEFGLVREIDDMKPMTDWNSKFEEKTKLGDLILAGRFGQWKYYWTDDCVLRGKFIAENL